MTVAQYLHSTAWAMLMALDDVFFLKPIPGGAMTRYLGQVCCREKRFLRFLRFLGFKGFKGFKTLFGLKALLSKTLKS